MTNTTLRQTALIAGIAILIMAILAGFAYGFVLDRLIVPGDATATADNIIVSETLFRAAVFSFLIVLICDVVVAWSLNVFLSPVSSGLSTLAAWLRLVYAAILGIAILNFTTVLILVTGGDHLKAFDEIQVKTLVLLLINAFNGIWTVGLVVFGCHLLVLGYLVFKSGYVPKVFGALLIVASICYLASNSASLLMSNFADYKGTVDAVLSAPMIVGELGFGLWLLFKGGRKSIAAVDTTQS